MKYNMKLLYTIYNAYYLVLTVPNLTCEILTIQLKKKN